MSAFRESRPLQDPVWRTDLCGHRHRSQATAEQCERREWQRREQATFRRVMEAADEVRALIRDQYAPQSGDLP